MEFSPTTLLLVLLVIGSAASFKPVVLMHGVLSGAENMVLLVREIEQLLVTLCFENIFVNCTPCIGRGTYDNFKTLRAREYFTGEYIFAARHPGTKVYNCDKFGGWSSLESAWRQVTEFRVYLDAIGSLHPEGVIVLGYSQGGIIARAAIQTLPNHNVKTFISLSSPQAGQYGASFLHLIFPDLAAKTAYELFYSKVGQHTSVGNYWNDPFKHDLYLKYSIFLPFVNNEVRSINSTDFKIALTRLEKMVLIGGPNDGVITPWESSHFSYYNSSLDVVPFYKRDIYTTDAIGLKTLKENGKLVIVVKPFVHHLSWHTNRHVIRQVILPFLD